MFESKLGKLSTCYYGDVLVWADWTSLWFYLRSSQQQSLGKLLSKSARRRSLSPIVCSRRTKKNCLHEVETNQCFSETFNRADRLRLRHPQYLLKAEIPKGWYWRAEEKHPTSLLCLSMKNEKKIVRDVGINRPWFYGKSCWTSTHWKVQWGQHGPLVEEIPQGSFNPKSPSLNMRDRCNYVSTDLIKRRKASCHMWSWLAGWAIGEV